jgi:hypothetical protein
VYDLADADDGILQAEVMVDTGSLEAYLSATGENQGHHTEASMDGHADQYMAAAVEGDADQSVGLSFVDSDTEGVQEGVDHEAQVLEQRAEEVINIDNHDSMHMVDPDVDDITDYRAQEPLDLERMVQMLTNLRHRGGDFEGDDMADENDEAEAEPVEGVPAEEVPIEGHLAEPLWTTQEPAECRLKLLQVSVYSPVHVYIILLINKY